MSIIKILEAKKQNGQILEHNRHKPTTEPDKTYLS